MGPLSDFLPHAYCLSRDWLVIGHAGSDLAIGLAYLFISFYLGGTIKHVRGTLAGIRGMVAIFIFWCALTHFMDIIVLWWPGYTVQLVVKLVTASVSVATAIMIHVYKDAIDRALGR